ncbi:hypothetical protein C1646_763704 [Rhizophagus diaphanus]|nr:hypothetical protein C1646_763704 [Rhizophagus diaphanus] [Rhizophagus sp. MUCL 43196]
MTQEQDKWATQFYIEKKDELDNLLILFEKKIDHGEMPKANEILRCQDTTKKIRRPPNSNIIYTNQIAKFGLLNIIRKFCDENGINKQKLVPISKKISANLWEKLSTEHQKFFKDLALDVKNLHQRMHPDYKYQPERKRYKSAKFIHYEPNNKSMMQPFVTSHDNNHKFDEQMEEDSYEDDYEYFEDDGLPKFTTYHYTESLSFQPLYNRMQDESYSSSSTSFNHSQQTINSQSSFNDINNPVNILACYLCGQLGHVVRNCPNRNVDATLSTNNSSNNHDNSPTPSITNTTENQFAHQLLVQSVPQEGEINSIFWNDALETRLCELYMKDDVVDIFWGQPVEESIKGITNWQVYVVTRGLHNSYAKTETITDNQVINFIAEEEKLISFDDPLPNSIKIPQDLEESFDEALDNELGLSFREKHYNLVGIGTGYKRIKGQLTNIPAIILYVRQKGILRRGCDGIFPKKICGFSVDVVEACVATPCASFDVDYCRRYQGDVKLGSSIGVGSNETLNTTGTLSAVACKKNSNRVGIISCEHVLKFNKSDVGVGVTVYQPSYKDLFEPKRKLDELCKLSKEPGINKDDYESIMYDIEHEENKLKRAKEKNSTLATYVEGMRKNFYSKIRKNRFGVDAGFCLFNNENRTLCPNKFSVPSTDFSTCLEGTYDLNDINNLKNLNPKTEIFKVGRTTGLTFGYLFPASQTIACSLTVESIKISKKFEMEKNIPFYDNLEQKTFIGYMKSHVDSEICQKRKKCFPVEWFDRQLAFLFKPGEFECGDSGASVVDKKGKALGILHAKLKTPNQTFAIASPYFAIIEALDVDICFSLDSITTAIPSNSSISSSSSPSSS